MPTSAVISKTALQILLSFSVAVCGYVSTAAHVAAQETVPEQISFNEHVRPILSNHCWNCHGRADNSRQAGLRLDQRDSALKAGDSGQPAIVPGNPEASSLIEKIHTTDPDLIMPPPAAKRPLSDVQKQILQKWIAQGAEYAEHWAFISPARPELPAVKHQNWARGPIDQFVLHRMEKEGLQPSPPAAPLVWLRRVTFDLTGFPPSLDEQNQFIQDLEAASLEDVKRRTVDRLLGSSRYAERMAMHWLDVARYADTNGYNNDETRTMWPWRDWVIQAYASGMPYNQFVVEQLAGDQLPNPTQSQKVATGFNRNHVLTTEGGIIEEEYHVEYVADRIHTTATVFLAVSMQCARCHDHKYDPISQRDYYQMAAFFNNVPDRIVSYSQGRMAEPLLRVPSPEQEAELKSIESRLQEISSQLAERRSMADADATAWEATLTEEQIASSSPPGLAHRFMLDEPEGPASDQVDPANSGTTQGKVESVEGRFGKARKFDGQTWIVAGQTGTFESDESFSLTAWVRQENGEAGTVLSKMDDASAYRGYDIIMEGGKVCAHFVHEWPDRAFKVVTEEAAPLQQWHHIAVIYNGSRQADGVRIYVDGKPQKLTATTNNKLDGTLKTEKPFHIGRRQTGVPFHGVIDEVQLYRTALSESDVARLAAGEITGGLKELVSTPAAERSEQQRTLLRDYFVDFVDPVTKQLRTEFADLPRRRDEIEKAIPVTMIMQEEPQRRPSFILKRGQYDQRGEQVPAGLPAVFTASASLTNSTPDSGVQQELSRLDFAKWLTRPDHPLTTRVAVNRWWEMLFGTGIVETSEDFGVQGALPSHPELLDWLATELVAQNWDQREILRQIVLSATYGQSSHVTPEQLEKDPRNRWLARGTRFRLPAETVRDSALMVSGLFRDIVGGPSVRPYQPEGLWEDVSVERRDKYVPDTGDGLYRRSMYTFWKRTCPPPTMSTFDAPDRETCVVRRARTNTPLQALVLMNDPTYLEAARKLAEHVLTTETTDENRWKLAYRLVLTRDPDAEEVVTLQSVLEKATVHFAGQKEKAGELLKVGHSASDPSLNPETLAAWTTVMSVILNLDEAISRP